MTSNGYDGFDEAFAAWRALWDHFSLACIVIVGWAIASSLAPWLLLHATALSLGIISHFFNSIPFKDHVVLIIFAYLLPSRLISLLAISSVAVAWHRYVLEGRNPNSVASLKSWRTFRYLGNAIYLGFIISAFAQGITASNNFSHPAPHISFEASQFVATLFGLLIFGVRMLIFPAIAINDRSLKFFGSSWSGLYRYTVTFAGGFLLSFLPFLVCSEALIECAEWVLGMNDCLSLAASGILSGFVYLLGVVSSATFLSRSYRTLLGNPVRFSDK